MSRPKIVAHTIVKNEQRWVWYALMSALDYVDEVMVWDTGSSDETVNIIKSISSPKIKFRSVGEVDAQRHSELRQRMLQETNADWILVLDGDEVWWKNSIDAVVTAINDHPDLSGIISPFYNAVGDVFHYQNPQEVSYHIKQYRGPYTIRAMNRKLPRLKMINPHGRQEYQSNGVAIQKLDDLLFIDSPFLHLTHLPRSKPNHDKNTLKRSFKYRYDLGVAFDQNFSFPEVFYLPAPADVPSPFFNRSIKYTFKSLAVSLLRFVKKMFTKPNNSGY